MKSGNIYLIAHLCEGQGGKESAEVDNKCVRRVRSREGRVIYDRARDLPGRVLGSAFLLLSIILAWALIGLKK